MVLDDSKSVAEAKDDIKKKDGDEEEKDTSFPVTDILNGIYKLVSSYVTLKPKPAAGDNEPSTTISTPTNPKQSIMGHINVHNMPRDQLFVEAFDEEHSQSDPFFQMQAPNLREDVPPNVNIDFSSIPVFPVKPNPPRAITLSPFDSPALKVQKAPKIYDIGVAAGPLPLNAPIERLSPEGFVGNVETVSYTHLTLPTNREV